MDPELLEKDELEYELLLRNLSSLSTSRLKTATLLRVMLEEERGDAVFPITNLIDVIPDSEYNICMGKLGKLGRLIDQGITTRDDGLIKRCFSRALHLKQRVNRLPVNDAFIGTKVAEIKDKSNDLLEKISYAKSNTRRNNDNAGAIAGAKDNRIEADLDRLELLEREISRLHSSFRSLTLQQLDLHNAETNNEFTRQPVIPLVPVPNNIQLNSTNPFMSDIELDGDNFSTPGRINSNQFHGQRDNINPYQNIPEQNNNINNLANYDQNRMPYRSAVQNNYGQNYNQGFQYGHQDNGASRQFSNYRENRYYRKQIPVQQWKISYSGENNLNDFLSQVEMFRQMENTSEQELLSTIGYLFTGRASKWLRVNFNRFRTWEEFKRALRDEFLPVHSDFNIIHDLDRRYQQKNESFSEYLANMLLLFSYMSDPPSAQHQLYYIRKNMSPSYAMAIASQSFDTIEQLSEICKRMDDTRNMLQRRGESNPASVVPDKSKTLNKNNPFIYELDETEDEIHAIENNSRLVKCWDCLETGHSFRACTNPQGRRFCFICGRREFTSRNCPQCSRAGNGRTNLAVPGTGQAL